MLGWILIGGLTGLACAFAAVLDRQAREYRRRLEADFRREYPEFCFECAYARFHDLQTPEHLCVFAGEKRDLVPAGGHEVVSATEQTAGTVGAIVTELEREGLPG